MLKLFRFLVGLLLAFSLIASAGIIEFTVMDQKDLFRT